MRNRSTPSRGSCPLRPDGQGQLQLGMRRAEGSRRQPWSGFSRSGRAIPAGAGWREHEPRLETGEGQQRRKRRSSGGMKNTFRREKKIFFRKKKIMFLGKKVEWRGMDVGA